MSKKQILVAAAVLLGALYLYRQAASQAVNPSSQLPR